MLRDETIAITGRLSLSKDDFANIIVKHGGK
jgi:hypothetical protein